jgi:hypothetical protein
MKAYGTSLLSVGAFLMLLCSISVFSRTTAACPVTWTGSSSFTASPGSTQIQNWSVTDDNAGGGEITLSITTGSDVFTVDQSQVTLSLNGTATFTITFNPGANSTGTFTGTLTTMGECGKTFNLVGTVAAAGVSNALPSNVSFTISSNPATDNVTIMSSGVLTAEIGIYNLLGNEIASSKMTTWQWDASSIPTGSYFVRIAGESNNGEQFVIWRRIIIAR